MVEQAAQLGVKSVILRILGYTPRTHRVRELLAVLAGALSSLNKSSLASRIKGFVEENRETLRFIEEAYTGSRYLYKVYEREDAEKSLRVVEKLLNLLRLSSMKYSPREKLIIEIQARRLRELLK